MSDTTFNTRWSIGCIHYDFVPLDKHFYWDGHHTCLGKLLNSRNLLPRPADRQPTAFQGNIVLQIAGYF